MLNDSMKQLELMGIYTTDAEPPIFKMIRALEADIKEHKRMINYMRKYGQNQSADNLEKWLKEEEAKLKAYKNIAKLAPTKDAEPHYKSNTGKTYTKTELESILKTRQKDFNDSKKREEAFRKEAKQLHDSGKDYKFKLEMAESERQMQNDIVENILNIKTALTKLTTDADPSDDIRGEYVQEMYRLEKEMARLYRMGQGAKAAKIDQELKKLRKELKELNTKDNDATENGAIEEFGQNHETEVMPLEKKPVLAQDESKREELERRIKDLEKEDYIDTFVMGDKPDPKTRKLIQQLKEELKKMPTKDEKMYQNGEHVKVVNHETGDKIELKVLRDNKDGTLEVKAPTGAQLTIKKAWIVDATPLFRWRSDIGRKDLKQMLEDLKRKKATLEQAISAQEHYYTNPKTKQDQQELAEIEMQISTVQHMLSKVTHDECMEVLKLSGFATDAYDPKKYEGTTEHERNLRMIENAIAIQRSNIKNTRERLTVLKNRSGAHYSGTGRETKQAEQELQEAREALQHLLSMKQRATGQKDEDPTTNNQ